MSDLNVAAENVLNLFDYYTFDCNHVLVDQTQEDQFPDL